MTDTPQNITRIQLEIMLAKPESEWFKIGDDLIAFGRKIIESSIRQEIPGITEDELRIEVFKWCYSSYYSFDELQRILVSMKEYLARAGDSRR
jgi:hypothetical protein